MLFNNKKFYKEIISEFNEINISLKSITTCIKDLNENNHDDVNQNINEMLNRFYKLFELHNISINEIPIIIESKFNITLFDLSTKKELLKKISNELLEWLADFFYINIDWLLCKTEYMYRIHNFDKDIIGLSEFINELSKNQRFSIELLKSSELNNKVVYGDDDGQYIYPVIIINQQVGKLTISKYILINSYMWSYKRTRLDLKVIIYLLHKGYMDYYKRRIFLSGYDFNIEYNYNDFIKGNCNYFDLKHRYTVTWYPEDYIEAENESSVSKETTEYNSFIEIIENNEYLDYLSVRLNYFGDADNFKNPMYNDVKKIVEEHYDNDLDNADKEQILEGEARTISAKAGQIYRGYTNADYGIDGEIEFKNEDGHATGKKLYLQLKSGDSYLYERKSDMQDVFYIKKERWVNYWLNQAYPVMLVIRTSDGVIRWMNISEYLNKKIKIQNEIKEIIFSGEEFTKNNIIRLKNKVFKSANDI